MSDPLLDAWYADDNGGYEGSDQCAWYFGTETGTAGAKYNQTINGHHYDLQLEWSNKGSKCLATYAPVPSIAKVSPSHGVVGQPIGIKGKNLTGVTGVTFNTTAAASFALDGKKLNAVVAPGTTTGPVHVTTSGGAVDGPTFT